MTLLKNSQSPDLQLQAGVSWDYIWNGNYAMKCLILRAEVLLAS